MISNYFQTQNKIIFLYEILFLLQLQDVLEKSDTMMAVVKDLFGDDPRVSILKQICLF